GQPFPITLEVVGEVTGEFTVSGTAAIETPFLAATTVPFTGVPPQAEVTLQVVESECIGEVSTLDGVNTRLRIRPGISSQEIASLASGTQVFLHDGYYDDWQWWWWRVTVVINPNLEGYIRSDLIINDDGCERI